MRWDKLYIKLNNDLDRQLHQLIIDDLAINEVYDCFIQLIRNGSVVITYVGYHGNNDGETGNDLQKALHNWATLGIKYKALPNNAVVVSGKDFENITNDECWFWGDTYLLMSELTFDDKQFENFDPIKYRGVRAQKIDLPNECKCWLFLYSHDDQFTSITMDSQLKAQQLVGYVFPKFINQKLRNKIVLYNRYLSELLLYLSLNGLCLDSSKCHSTRHHISTFVTDGENKMIAEIKINKKTSLAEVSMSLPEA